MKWFKHETDAVHSEKLNKLIDLAGFEGYGRFFRVMEVIAERMDESDKCSVDLSVRRWGELLGYPPKCRTDYILSFFNLLGVCGLCAVDVIPHITTTSATHTNICIRTSIPNLLKKRDNYTKHLQANLQVTDKPSLSISSSSIKNSIKKKEYKNGLSRFDDFWNLYPKHKDRASAEKAWKALKDADKELIISALPSYNFPDDEQFIKYPGTWLRAKSWLDEETKRTDGEWINGKWHKYTRD